MSQPCLLSVLRKTRVAKAAHMTEVDHELAAVLYTHKAKPTGGCETRETNKAKQQKLARMTAVRSTEQGPPQVLSVSHNSLFNFVLSTKPKGEF